MFWHEQNFGNMNFIRVFVDGMTPWLPDRTIIGYAFGTSTVFLIIPSSGCRVTGGIKPVQNTTREIGQRDWTGIVNKNHLLIGPVHVFLPNVCVAIALVYDFTNFASTNQKSLSKLVVHKNQRMVPARVLPEGGWLRIGEDGTGVQD